MLSADGDIGKFGVTARTTRYGKVISPGAASPIAPNPTSLTAFGPDDIFLSAKWITDVEVRLQAARRRVRDRREQSVRRLSGPLAVRRRGRRRSAAASIRRTRIYMPYSIFSPFGFNGRFVYGRVSVNF